MKDRIKYYFLLIITVGLILRIVNISAPLLEWQDWRQTYTAMISRNFYLNGFNILLPQVDLDGSNPGYVACEFPIYQYIVANFYRVFGVQDWIGRSISVVFSIGSMILIFIITKLYYSYTAALISMAFFAILPTNVFYSRAFMPESMLIFCSLATIYLFIKWLKKEKILLFVLSAFFFSLAIAIKPFTLYLSLPICYLAYLKYNKGIFTKWYLWGFFIIALIIPVGWYTYAQINLKTELFGSLWNFKERWGNFKLWLSPKFYSKILFSRLAEMILTYTGFIFWILGMTKIIDNEEEYLFHLWVIGIFGYFLIIAQGNWEHDYYQLPLVPVACIFMGKFLASFFQIKRKKIYYVLIIVLLIYAPVYSLIKLFVWLEPQRSKRFLVAAESVRKYAPKNSIILVSDESNPEVIYYSQRKGWHINPKSQNRQVVREYIKKGANYYVTTDLKRFNNNTKFKNYMNKAYKLIDFSNIPPYEYLLYKLR